MSIKRIKKCQFTIAISSSSSWASHRSIGWFLVFQIQVKWWRKHFDVNADKSLVELLWLQIFANVLQNKSILNKSIINKYIFNVNFLLSTKIQWKNVYFEWRLFYFYSIQQPGKHHIHVNHKETKTKFMNVICRSWRSTYPLLAILAILGIIAKFQFS